MLICVCAVCGGGGGRRGKGSTLWRNKTTLLCANFVYKCMYIVHVYYTIRKHTHTHPHAFINPRCWRKHVRKWVIKRQWQTQITAIGKTSRGSRDIQVEPPYFPLLCTLNVWVMRIFRSLWLLCFVGILCVCVCVQFPFDGWIWLWGGR